ncbi:MAG: glycosyltransferase family 2 protein [Ardenticatenaceae bacterium]|nr:glycosyltransferase family 2 protein [Anaerolineales bacterium]MCB8922929.1 glycosyltransferase family 2 protein [Ardenticatenaceae bacterium]MCB8990335.1 glycosyltransferase family 2 protein [Ardenticatenaceae bacterium]MCB9005228.1 glycosyltransferase family 2 protein [Ardenticatenaceae bacterium]
MEQDDIYLSVVIPAYNEEKRITPTLESVYDYLSHQPFTWEVLVALDGPTDDTLGVVQAFAAGKPQVRWLNRTENRGKGYTVREGMLAARGQIRLFMDADNSTDITHFAQMQPLFDEGSDVVIGSRDGKDVSGAKQAVPQPFLKRLLGDAGNLFIQLMAVPGIWDTQCGFKGFTAVAAQRIFSVSQIDRWGFDMEALAIARKLKYRIAIIATRWVDDADTHVNLGDYVNTVFEVLRVRWHLLTGAYQ